MGNLNYPAIAKRSGFSSSLTMDVGIKPNGSIYSIRISKSSGYPALDQAAKRIVKLSAPFPPDGLLFCLHLRYRSDSDKTTGPTAIAD
jgi:protein TonB